MASQVIKGVTGSILLRSFRLLGSGNVGSGNVVAYAPGSAVFSDTSGSAFASGVMRIAGELRFAITDARAKALWFELFRIREFVHNAFLDFTIAFRSRLIIRPRSALLLAHCVVRLSAEGWGDKDDARKDETEDRENDSLH